MRPTPTRGVAVEVHGERYPSAAAAGRAIGLTGPQVVYRCDSPQSFPGFRWAPPADDEEEPAPLARPLIEPARWRFVGDLLRRASVLDPNEQPPRVVRRVGYLACIRCRRAFWSDDVLRVRMCAEHGLGGLPIGRADDGDL